MAGFCVILRGSRGGREYNNRVAMLNLFKSLNATRQIDSNNSEFWDYYNLYHITFDLWDDAFDQGLPNTVFSCDHTCPNYADTRDLHWHQVWHCTGGQWPLREFLEPNALMADRLDQHAVPYLTRNNIDFSCITSSERPRLYGAPDLPNSGDVIISAKLSRLACYGLFNQLFIQQNRYSWDSPTKTYRRLVDAIPDNDKKLFLLIYFMNPQTPFPDLKKLILWASRIRAQQSNREWEKRLSGIIYNICANNRDFSEIRNATKDTLFYEMGRPVTPSGQPAANYYKTPLLDAVNGALCRLVDQVSHPHDDTDDTNKPRRLKKNELLCLVKNEFARARMELTDRGIQPEFLFSQTDVRQLKTMLNQNERQFFTHYSKFGLSK